MQSSQNIIDTFNIQYGENNNINNKDNSVFVKSNNNINDYPNLQSFGGALAKLNDNISNNDNNSNRKNSSIINKNVSKNNSNLIISGANTNG